MLDGHNSHINQAFLDYCEAYNIHIAVYPPYSTHWLQPLDIGVFAPLAIFYSQNLDCFIQESQGLSSVTKRHFFLYFLACF